jgi:hypothetical protein
MNAAFISFLNFFLARDCLEPPTLNQLHNRSPLRVLGVSLMLCLPALSRIRGEDDAYLCKLLLFVVLWPWILVLSALAFGSFYALV